MSEMTASREQSLGLGKTIIIGLAGLFYAYGVWSDVAYLAAVAGYGLNAYG